MCKLLVIIFSFLSISIFANNQYEISLIEIDHEFEQHIQVEAINDKGQLLGQYCNKQDEIFLFDAVEGLTIINTDHPIPYNNSYPIAFNNMGQVLGYALKPKLDNRDGCVYYCYFPFMWNRALGIQWLDVFNSSYILAHDLNDLGQVIGTYLPDQDYKEPLFDIFEFGRPFLWDNRMATDLGVGSEFSNSIETFGYHIMEINLERINNKGEMVGFFAFGKYNKKKNKYVKSGLNYFFWDGEMHVITLPKDNQNKRFKIVKVNNNGVVLISNDFNTTYLWDKQNDLRRVKYFSGVDINDSNVLLGTSISDNFGIPYKKAIWKDGNIFTLEKLLGVKDIGHIDYSYSDSIVIEDIYTMNNKGQIQCDGSIKGVSHLFFLNPVTTE